LSRRLNKYSFLNLSFDSYFEAVRHDSLTRFTDTTIHWHHDSLTLRFTDNTKSVGIHIFSPAPNTKSVPFTTKIFCIRGGASNMYSYTLYWGWGLKYVFLHFSYCQWIVGDPFWRVEQNLFKLKYKKWFEITIKLMQNYFNFRKSDK
jgi:hypothetical protein